MWTFRISLNKKLMLLFLSEKNQNLLDIQERCIRKLEKIQSVLNVSLVIIIDF